MHAKGLPKSDALLLLDRAVWEALERVNGVDFELTLLGEQNAAYDGLDRAMRAIDAVAEAIWRDTPESADDVTARAVLARHYSMSISGDGARVTYFRKAHSQRAHEELMRATIMHFNLRTA